MITTCTRIFVVTATRSIRLSLPSTSGILSLTDKGELVVLLVLAVALGLARVASSIFLLTLGAATVWPVVIAAILAVVAFRIVKKGFQK